MEKLSDPLSKDRINSVTKAPIRKDYLNSRVKDSKVKTEDYAKMDDSTGRYRFKKGNPGRPKGSHRGYTLSDLQKAIKKVEKKRKLKYFETMIEKSLDEPSIFIAILKRLVAEQKLGDDEGIKIINIIRSGNSTPAPKQEPIEKGKEPDEKI